VAPDPATLLLAWGTLASLVALLLAAWDKRQARRGAARIRERTLLLWALIGGSPGLVLGMLLSRHKTRKGAFLLPLALILLAQGGAAWLLLRGQ
jgi:uncharacterized membrane protein YsdA (DUF1294 family)